MGYGKFHSKTYQCKLVNHKIVLNMLSVVLKLPVKVKGWKPNSLGTHRK